MRRRRWATVILVGLLAAVAAAVLWPRGPHPCLETFKQVREGMTRAEVYATVGGPPNRQSDTSRAGMIVGRWDGDDGSTLGVLFETDNRAFKVSVVGRSRWQRLWARLRS